MNINLNESLHNKEDEDNFIANMIKEEENLNHSLNDQSNDLNNNILSNNNDNYSSLESNTNIDIPKEYTALAKIDEKSTKLQQEGKYNEALKCMEQGLILRQHFYGSNSIEVIESCKTIAELCNLLAMTYLQQEEFSTVFELLKKADILTQKKNLNNDNFDNIIGRAVTMNNFACYYRRQGNLHAAYKKLILAIDLEKLIINDPSNSIKKADTHLNMCAVLSQLGKHQAALEHAQTALILLHEELFIPTNQQTNMTITITNSNYPNLSTKADRVAVLGIAYHNVGVEYEFLKKYECSIQSYKKGLEITEKILEKNHGIIITLNNSFILTKQLLQKKLIKQPNGNNIDYFTNDTIHNKNIIKSKSLKKLNIKNIENTIIKKKC